MKGGLGLITIFVALALMVAGCGGDDEKSERADTAAEQSTQTESEREGEILNNEPSTETDTRPEADSPPPNSDAHSEAHEAGEAGRVRARLAMLFKAVRAEDSGKVCSLLTRDTRKLIGSSIGSDCEGGMDYAFSVFPSNFDGALKKIRIKRVSVSGNKATATIFYPRKVRQEPTFQYFTANPELGLTKEDKEWRVPLVSP